MKRTISAMVGKGSVNHNSRKFLAENVDGRRTHLNIDYCNENIKAVYHELFDEALKRYNDRQTRADRRIEDYYEKIRSSKQEKPFHEIILQIGNKDDMSADSEEGQLAAAVLDEYMRGFQERNPQLRVFSAHLHMDEATPHLHIDFVPFTTGSKRGLETRVSLKQALASRGFKGGTKGDTEWNQWARSEKEQLAAVMERHGIEWEDKGTHDKHLSVLEYKKEQRAKEIADLETVKAEAQEEVKRQEQRLKELAPAVEGMEQLAARFSDDPERILPEPGPLESARAYREKKTKPLLAQIVKVLRSLYAAYVDLKRKFERLQGDYGQVRESNARLSERLQEVKLENKGLRGIAADYERVKRAFGAEEVERAVEDTKRREAAEKGQQREKRKHKEKYIPTLLCEINVAKQIEGRYKAEIARCGRNCGLHEKYQDNYIVRRFISYLDEGRCDTLKECINLYVQEDQQYWREVTESEHRERMEDIAKQQLQDLKKIRDDASRSATASERAAKRADDAAFWSAVTAYEIDKLSRG